MRTGGPGRTRRVERAEPDPDATAFVLYTSGTTGAPKGRSSRGARWRPTWTRWPTRGRGRTRTRWCTGCRCSTCTVLCSGAGALRTGSRLVHTGKPTPAAYAAAGGSLYFGVPTVWNRVAQDATAARALAGRGCWSPAARAARAGVPARGGADRAAAGGAVRHDRVAHHGEHPRRRGAATGLGGLPLSGIRTRIVAEEGAEIGELQLTGPTLFDGYLGRPEATAASYTDDGWFRTGDIATVEPDGFHRIVGRASTDMIKSGGYRIGAGEVENALLDHPAVREAAVVGAPHEDLGQQIVAYVVADGVAEKDLIDFVAGHLSAHKRPRHVRFLEALPRNAMGKPQKKLLPRCDRRDRAEHVCDKGISGRFPYSARVRPSLC
ncbi:AMP-binding protein [Streptomyces sp. M19]